MSDKEAFNHDRKEHIAYNQKISRAKIELRSRLPKRLLKRKELWVENKTRWQIFKIQFSITWRKFDLMTRGMGLMFVCLLGIMLIATMIPNIIGYFWEQLDKTKYSEALKTSCLNTTFYSWNFKQCENVDARPIIPDEKKEGNQI